MSRSRGNLQGNEREILKILEGDDSEEECVEDNEDEYDILANIVLAETLVLGNTEEILTEEATIIATFGKF